MLILRHASAGKRLSPPHIDRFRELDEAGRTDARQLVWTLANQAFDRIVTSPLVRCVETVIPIAESRRVVIEQRDELLPEAELEAVLGLLEELPDTTLLCTHREVIQQLFAGEVACEKGGSWVLEHLSSLWSPLEYLPPPMSVIETFSVAALSR